MSPTFKNTVAANSGGVMLSDDDDEKVAAARAALPDHGITKADHIEAIGFTQSGTVGKIDKTIADITERMKNTRSEIARRDYAKTFGQARFSHDDDAKTEKMASEAERDKNKIKQLRKTREQPPTITIHELLRPINPRKQYVDARVDVTSKDPARDLNKSREKIVATKGKRQLVKERSRYTLEEADARLVADVERMARKGAIKFGGCLARVIDVTGRPTQEGVRWPVEFSGSGYTIHDGMGSVAYLLKERIIEIGREELKRLNKPELAFTNAGRKAKLAELDAEILAEERREEALVELCEEAGIEVLRRPDANPFAVLGIALAGGESIATPDDESDMAADDSSEANADDDPDMNADEVPEGPDADDADLDFG